MVCAQEVLAVSLRQQRCWDESKPGWWKWWVGGRMAVPGVGGNVMFFPPKPIPGSKPRPELPSTA